MHQGTIASAGRLVLLASLVGMWLIGLAGQRSIVEGTGYLDVSPELLVLGIVLCTLAGAVARAIAPRHRRVRIGALAGIAMIGTIVTGYLLLAVAYGDRFDSGEGGETWFSLLLESWFWIGVPLVVSAILGAIGWVAADALDRLARRPARLP